MKIPFHVGQQFGELEVIAVNNRKVTVRCSCGKEVTMNFSSIVKRHEQPRVTCGNRACRAVYDAKRLAEEDARFVGRRYGALQVKSVYRTRNEDSKHKGTILFATVQCECGTVFDTDTRRMIATEMHNCGCGRIRIDPMWKLALYTRWAA